MAQPGRMYNNGDYRYGYNGKEEDNEVKGGDGKSLDYGARWYDPRKARWDAVDPLFAEYSSDSPYLYSKNDPINIIDIEGEQPIRGQLAHIGQILGTMKKHITDAGISKDSWLKQITILAKSMGTDQYVYRSKKDGNFYQEPKSIAVSRYIYTTKGGWIDMKHFLTAAVETYHKGAVVTLNLGYAVELEQKMKGSTSAFSYEDLPSNALGALFMKEYSKKLMSGEMGLLEAVAKFMWDLHPTLPSEAPNYELIPYDLNDKSVPQVYTGTGVKGDELLELHETVFDKKSKKGQQDIKDAEGKVTADTPVKEKTKED